MGDILDQLAKEHDAARAGKSAGVGVPASGDVLDRLAAEHDAQRGAPLATATVPTPELPPASAPTPSKPGALGRMAANVASVVPRLRDTPRADVHSAIGAPSGVSSLTLTPVDRSAEMFPPEAGPSAPGRPMVRKPSGIERSFATRAELSGSIRPSLPATPSAEEFDRTGWRMARDADRGRNPSPIPGVDIAFRSMEDRMQERPKGTLGEAIGNSAVTIGHALPAFVEFLGNTGKAALASPYDLWNRGAKAIGLAPGYGADAASEAVREGGAAVKGFVESVPAAIGATMGNIGNPRAALSDPVRTTMDAAGAAAPVMMGLGAASAAGAPSALGEGAGALARVGEIAGRATSGAMQGMGGQRLGSRLVSEAGGHLNRAGVAAAAADSLPGAIAAGGAEFAKGIGKGAAGLALDQAIGGHRNLINAPQWGIGLVGKGLKLSPTLRKGLVSPVEREAEGLRALLEADPRNPVRLATARQEAESLRGQYVEPVLGRMSKVPRESMEMPPAEPLYGWEKRIGPELPEMRDLPGGGVRVANRENMPPRMRFRSDEGAQNRVVDLGRVYSALDAPAGGFVRVLDKDGMVAWERELGPGGQIPREARREMFRAARANPGSRIETEVVPRGGRDAPSRLPTEQRDVSAVVAGQLGSMQATIAMEALRTLPADVGELAAEQLFKRLPHSKQFAKQYGLPERTDFPQGVTSALDRTLAQKAGDVEHMNTAENVLETQRAQADEMVNNVAVLRTADRWLTEMSARARAPRQAGIPYRTVSFKDMPTEARALVRHYLGTNHGNLTQATASRAQVPAATADVVEAMLATQKRGWQRWSPGPVGRGLDKAHGAYVTAQLMVLPTSALNNTLSNLTQALPAVLAEGLTDYAGNLVRATVDYATGPRGLPDMRARLDFGHGRALTRGELVRALGGETAYGIESRGLQPGGRIGQAVEWNKQQYGQGALSDMASKEAMVRSYLNKHPEATIEQGIDFAERYLLAYHKMPDLPRQLSATAVPFLNWTWGATPVVLRSLGDFPAVFNALSVANDAAELRRAARDNVDVNEMWQRLAPYLQETSYQGVTPAGDIVVSDVSRKAPDTLALSWMRDLAAGGREPGFATRRNLRGALSPALVSPLHAAGLGLLGDKMVDLNSGRPIWTDKMGAGERAWAATKATFLPFIAPSGAVRAVEDVVPATQRLLVGNDPTIKETQYPTGAAKSLPEIGKRFVIGATETVIKPQELLDRASRQFTSRSAAIGRPFNAKEKAITEQAERDKLRLDDAVRSGRLTADEASVQLALINDRVNQAIAEIEREREAAVGDTGLQEESERLSRGVLTEHPRRRAFAPLRIGAPR
ncbi:MAG: hypothetical protein WC789_10675 [Lentisphaeria bacterium]